MRIGTIAVSLGGAFLLGILVLGRNFPEIPHGLLGWGVIAMIAIPMWCFFEWCGGIILRAKSFAEMPTLGRITVGVPIVAILLIGIGAIILLVNQVMSGQ